MLGEVTEETLDLMLGLALTICIGVFFVVRPADLPT